MQNKILFITATHGDEQLGVEVIENIFQTRKDFDWIIGNYEAFRRGIRFYQKDLNRCGRGNKDSKIYEERRAAEIQKIVKKYEFVVDIHGDKNNCGIFIIITNPTKANFILASKFPIETIVIWPSITDEMKSPMSEFFSCGVEIECGNKYLRETKIKLYRIVKSFLDFLSSGQIDDIKKNKMIKLLNNKKIFILRGDIKKREITDDIKLKEFQDIMINNEEITPVFVNTYDYSDVVAYKLQKFTTEDVCNKYLYT